MSLEDVAAFTDARIDSALQAISDERPAGQSVRGEPDFDALETEVRRLETEGPGAVNWRQVSEDGIKLLSTRGKDLLVGVWVSFGLFQLEKLKGLAVGGAILRGLVETYWADMQPPAARERARVSALEWLVGRVAAQIPADNLTEADWPIAIAAYDAINDIDRLASEKLTKEQLALGELIRAIRPLRDEARRGLAEQAAAREAAQKAAEDAAQAAETAASAPPPAAAAQAAAPPATTATSAAPLPIGDDVDPDVAIAQLPAALRQLGDRLRSKNVFDVRAFVLVRTGSWLRLRQPPPDQGGRTGVAPPQAELAAIEAHRAAGRHRDVISACEEAVWSVPLWFDGHRLSAEALSALGAEGAACASAIRGAVAGLFQRFPELTTLCFADGVPFAAPATVQWAGASGSGGTAAAVDPTAELISDAKGAIAGGRVPEALEHMALAARQAQTGRIRTQIQIAQAGISLDIGLVQVALPLLDHVTSMIDHHDLEGWEPDIATKASELRLRALMSPEAMRTVPEERRRIQLDDVRLRLSRLDFAAAARMLR